MLYVVGRGHEGYRDGQDPIVHLVSSFESAVGAGRPWCFTDRHADLGYANYFDDAQSLRAVSWDVMDLTWWNEGDVRELRQAEFLCHDHFPWSAIEEVGVRTDATKQQVEATIAHATHRPPVVVRSDWYYPG